MHHILLSIMDLLCSRSKSLVLTGRTFVTGISNRPTPELLNNCSSFRSVSRTASASSSSSVPTAMSRMGALVNRRGGLGLLLTIGSEECDANNRYDNEQDDSCALATPQRRD